MRLGIKLVRSLGGLHMHLTWIACKKRYGVFDRWGMAAGEIAVTLVVNGLHVNRSVEGQHKKS